VSDPPVVSDPWQPDRQRVVIVGVTGWPEGTPERIEAVQLTFGPPPPLPAVELEARVLEAVKADRHTYEERRSGSNWGAAGLTTQDIEVAILIGYTAGTAAGLTVAAS
jgi:hypothetical protein